MGTNRSTTNKGSFVIGGRVFIDGNELPPLPNGRKGHNVTVINNKVYIDGFEYKNNKWKRTLKGLFHLCF